MPRQSRDRTLIDAPVIVVIDPAEPGARRRMDPKDFYDRLKQRALGGAPEELANLAMLVESFRAATAGRDFDWEGAARTMGEKSARQLQRNLTHIADIGGLAQARNLLDGLRPGGRATEEAILATLQESHSPVIIYGWPEGGAPRVRGFSHLLPNSARLLAAWGRGALIGKRIACNDAGPTDTLSAFSLSQPETRRQLRAHIDGRIDQKKAALALGYEPSPLRRWLHARHQRRSELNR